MGLWTREYVTAEESGATEAKASVSVCAAVAKFPIGSARTLLVRPKWRVHSMSVGVAWMHVYHGCVSSSSEVSYWVCAYTVGVCRVASCVGSQHESG